MLSTFAGKACADYLYKAAPYGSRRKFALYLEQNVGIQTSEPLAGRVQAFSIGAAPLNSIFLKKAIIMYSNRQFFSHLGWAAVLTLTACVKTEIVPEILAPKLTVTPVTVSLTTGQTFALSATYTDEAAIDQSAQVQWRSSAPSIASVSTVGLVTAKIPGQIWAVALAPGGLADSTLVTVVQNENAVASVAVVAAQTVINIGATLQFSAKAFNSSNQEIGGQTVTWASTNDNVLSISATGLATGVGAGTASVTASVAGVNSLPLAIQVVPTNGISRTGTFMSSNGYSTKGAATLQQTANELTLILGNDFHASNGPQLGIFLAKNASGSLNAQNSLSLGNLEKNDGAQQYAVPAGVSLQDYDYVVIYCIPFNVRFGSAKLSN